MVRLSSRRLGVSSPGRSSGSTSASPYVELDLRRSNRIDHMDAEPNYPAPNMNDAAAKAARKKIKRAEKKEATLQQNRERQATAMKDEQLLYETLAKEVDNTLDDAALSRSDKALRGAIMGVLRFLASSDGPTTRGKAYQLAALYSNFSERTVRRHFERYWKTGELPASQQGRHAKTFSYLSDATVRKECLAWLDNKRKYKAEHPKSPDRHWWSHNFHEFVNETLRKLGFYEEDNSGNKIPAEISKRQKVPPEHRKQGAEAGAYGAGCPSRHEDEEGAGRDPRGVR